LLWSEESTIAYKRFFGPIALEIPGKAKIPIKRNKTPIQEVTVNCISRVATTAEQNGLPFRMFPPIWREVNTVPRTRDTPHDELAWCVYLRIIDTPDTL
jgi:hypothetical protein